MKINFILPGIGKTGGTAVVNRYASMLKDDGFDVEIYAPIISYNLHRKNNALIDFLYQLYGTLKTFLEKRNYPYHWVFRIKDKYIRDADITLATAWPTAYDVNELREECGGKIYFVQDYEVWDNYELGQKSYLLPLRKIVISSWINEQLKKDLDIGPFEICLNGIDTDFYSCDGLKDEKKGITLLMLNHKLVKKGVRDGLEACKRVKEKMPKVKVIMFGMLSEKNLPDFVDEYYRDPSKEKIRELYCKADVFVFPSLSEGWGLTPIEAMACGCAVVGYNTGFVLDIGNHMENMVVCESGNVDSLTAGVLDLCEDAVLRKKLGKSGRETVEKLDWDSAYNHFKGIIY